MTKPVHLFMASTPLHVLLSTAIVCRNRNKLRAHLFLIEQASVEDSPYHKILQSWQDNPFENIKVVRGGAKGKEKVRLRKLTFREINQWTDKYRPEQIYVGNDRRIEFQFAMHSASQFKPVVGNYLDEGTFTYVGRKASSRFSDRVVDNLAKKLVYGCWWKHPPTIGGSKWIKNCFVAFPKLVHPLLAKKQLIEVDQSYFNNEQMQSFSKQVVDHFQLDTDKLAQLSCLVTLPHESVMDKIPQYRENILALIKGLNEKAGASGQLIGLKYHPRNSSPDIFNLAQFAHCWIVPDGAAYETFLPLLPESIKVIGDMSSTLISTKWLRPDITTIAIENRHSELFDDFEALFNELDIKICPSSQLSDYL